MKSYVILCYCFFIVSCQQHKPFSDKNVTHPIYSIVYLDVSAAELIAHPEKYHNLTIRTTGYLHLEFESTCLYADKKDYDQHTYKNALWVDVKTRHKMDSLLNFSNHYIIIEGKFDSKDKGNIGTINGSIKTIKQIKFVPLK